MRDIGRGLADERSEQLLMRRRPRNLLDDDMNPGILPLELGDECLNDLPLAAESPEFDALTVICLPRGATDQGEREEKSEC
jgi:hypothetical protein